MDIEDIQKKRFQFIQKLYELSGGDELNWYNMWDIGKQLGFDRDMTDAIGQYLSSEGLIEFHTFGPTIGITHRGVKVVENALTNPNKPTDYFPPVNIISAGDIVNSQIQLGSPGAQQSVGSEPLDYEKLEVVLKLIEARLNELELSSQQKSDIDAHVETIRAQMGVSKPKISVIRECLTSIRHTLEGMAGSILASELLQQIQRAWP